MSIGELGCPTLDYVYDMTWAEFRIRLDAYNRIQKKEWIKTREVAWASLIGSHLDPKKLPNDKESFIPLSEKQGISDNMFDRIKQAQDKYKIEKQ